MSEMPPLQKCKHPGSVLREFQRGCFPGITTNLVARCMKAYLSRYWRKRSIMMRL
ncbi:hypothetical protein T11_16896 [Trichinella zimbabwensis]|uniref:Uncharacterized protein n=1 Tax=Trichinella zimbabwensis TaxID=268475 RepID=A0A0V1GMK6_9BILA|nr:hypothetical protein T11_16896 [Trichinella zimbabwensis]